MNYKKFILIALIIMIITLTGCQKEEKVDIRGSITGINMSDKITSIMVEGELEEDTSYDKASIKIDNSTKIYIGKTKEKASVEHFKEGIIVEVTFEGPVAESYPVQATAKIIRIVDQDKDSQVSEALKEESIEAFKLQESDYITIDNILNAKKDIIVIQWSFDKSTVAFAIDNGDGESQMYLWQTGNHEPVRIDDVNDIICEFKWSPNNEYIIADVGTSVARGGYVVDVKEKELLYNIGYIDGVLWSPDSKHIAMIQESQVKAVVETELEGTTDVYLLNIETKEKQLIDEGTSEYSLRLISWDDDGKLNYNRAYYKEPEKIEIFTYIY